MDQVRQFRTCLPLSFYDLQGTKNDKKGISQSTPPSPTLRWFHTHVDQFEKTKLIKESKNLMV